MKGYKRYHKKLKKWEKLYRSLDGVNVPPQPQMGYQDFYTPDICMAHKWAGDGSNRVRRIKRTASFETMRNDPRAIALRNKEHPNGSVACK